MDVTSVVDTQSRHIYHRRNFLIFLFLIQTLTRFSDSFTIIRGKQDQFVSSSSSNVSGGSTSCENNRATYCICDPGQGTLIWENETGERQCLPDSEIIELSTAPGSKFLFNIGVYLKAFGNSTTEVFDDGDDLSTYWIWLKTGQLLNVETLTCLEATTEETSQRFLMAQCDQRNMKQGWRCNDNFDRVIVNNGTPNRYRENWINPSSGSDYLMSCTDFSSYKGCYRFSNGDFLRLVNPNINNCEGASSRCQRSLIIRAPIHVQHPECFIDWRNSTYSVDGHVWLSLRDHPNEFLPLATESDQEKFLQLSDVDRFFQKWNGTLMRLEVQCRSGDHEETEKHCVLLKIEGTFKRETVPLTEGPPTTSVSNSATVFTRQSPSSTTSSHPTHPTTRAISETTNCVGFCNNTLPEANLASSKTIPIVVSTVLTFLVIVAVVTTLTFHRQRKRSKSGRNLTAINEEHNTGQSRDESIYAEPDANLGASHVPDSSEYENLDPSSTASPSQVGAWPSAPHLQGHTEYQNLEAASTVSLGQASESNRISEDLGESSEWDTEDEVERSDWDFENETTSLSIDEHLYDRVENKTPEGFKETDDHVYQVLDFEKEPVIQDISLEGGPQDPSRPESFYDTVEEVAGSEHQLSKFELSEKDSDGHVYDVLEEPKK